MASKQPGLLGTSFNPGHGPIRTLASTAGAHRPTYSAPWSLAGSEHGIQEAAHRVSRAIGWNQTLSAAYLLVGRQSFTAGVVVGMGENLLKSIVSAVELLNMLSLAEYWESRHDHSFMARMRTSMFSALSPGNNLGMDALSHFWPGFDRKCQDAYEQRGAIADALAHAFTHPKEFLTALTKSQEAKAREFVDLLKQQSLSGNFHAGVLMGSCCSTC